MLKILTKKNNSNLNDVFFSVIIPTYNRAEKLRRCLKHLERQTYQHFEVLVCDDGSADNTREVVASFKQKGINIKYFYNNNWGGPAFPRNIGISNAIGEWLCFLDADDWWYAGKLAAVAPHCKSGKYDLIYHDFDIFVNEVRTNKVHRGRALDSPVFEDLFINDSCIVNSSVCVRKELVLKAGKFSEDKKLIAMEDYDLWLRCSRISEKFKYVNTLLGGYDASGEDNITTKGLRQIERVEHLFRLHLPFLRNKYLKQRATINWSYKKGLIFRQMGDHATAKYFFKISLGSGNLKIKIKSMVHICKLLLKQV